MEPIYLEQRVSRLEELTQEQQNAGTALHDLERRLREISEHGDSQKATLSERLDAVESLIEEFDGTDSHKVGELYSRISHLHDATQTLESRLNDLVAEALHERTTRLESEQGIFASFSESATREIESLKQQLAELSLRDDQLLDLISQTEVKLEQWDATTFENRVQEVESEIAGFRSVIREVRQKFDGIEERFGDLYAKNDHVAGQLNELSNRIQNWDSGAVTARLDESDARVGQITQWMGEVGPSVQSLHEHVQRQTRTISDQQQRLAQWEQAHLPDRVKALEDEVEGESGRQSSLAAIQEKLERLERENEKLSAELKRVGDNGSRHTDWLGRGLGAGGIAVAAVVALVALWPSGTISANRFVLLNGQGAAVSTWESSSDGATLQLSGPADSAQVMLASSPHGSKIALSDSADKERVMLGVHTEEGCGLVFQDASGTPRLTALSSQTTALSLRGLRGQQSLTLTADGAAADVTLFSPDEQPQVKLATEGAIRGVSVYDEAAQLRAGLGMSEDGSALNLFDEASLRRVVLSSNQAGPALAFYGNDNRHRTTLGITDADESVLNLHDPAGKHRLVLQVSDSKAALSIFDRDQNTLFAAP